MVRDRYRHQREPEDPYQIFCVNCEHCAFSGECKLNKTPEECAREYDELTEAQRDDRMDKKADERRMGDE